jgi:type II secretory pathway pseudopilin PulG
MKNIIRKLVKNKKGTTLVEAVIAVGMFSIIATALVSVLISSNKVTNSNMELRQNYESSVGRMDSQLETSVGTEPPAGSTVVTSDVDVTVKFPSGSTASVACEQSLDGSYGGIGIVKAK